MQVAQLPAAVLEPRFGERARWIAAAVRGISDEAVQVPLPRRAPCAAAPQSSCSDTSTVQCIHMRARIGRRVSPPCSSFRCSVRGFTSPLRLQLRVRSLQGCHAVHGCVSAPSFLPTVRRRTAHVRSSYPVPQEKELPKSMLAAKSFQVTAVPAPPVCAGKVVSYTPAGPAVSCVCDLRGAWGPILALCGACSSVLRPS